MLADLLDERCDSANDIVDRGGGRVDAHCVVGGAKRCGLSGGVDLITALKVGKGLLDLGLDPERREHRRRHGAAARGDARAREGRR